MTAIPRHTAARPGIAMLVTLIFLALFACLAVAIAASADTNMVVTRNRIYAQQAGALAETGLQLTQRSLGGLQIASAQTAADLHAAIGQHLAAAWASSGMVNAAAIQWDDDAVTVPAMTVPGGDGGSGAIDLSLEASGGAADTTTITVHSTGRFRNASRSVSYNMTVQRGTSALMAYGIASKSAIQMTGNARISGATSADEGSVLSATYSTTNAISLTGNVNIAGDVGVVNPDGKVKKTGNITIGGDEIVGMDEPEWPEVDPSVFRPYAINTQATGTSGNTTLSNIIIPPNTNPTFAGNTVIYGVVYVQSPNKVKFTGNTVLVGCIVCDPPAVDNLTANSIQFTGNMSSAGVESLPAGSTYDGLRELTGSFLLAPGFSASFTGNFSTVNGCMVASQFSFTGNAGGRVKGGIINLRDSSFTLTGNANITIDRENAVQHPAGLGGGFRLVCVSGSYAE